MSKYRKVDPRIWNDAKFRELSDGGKLVFLMLLTHPGMTALGAMRATIAGLAEELGWEPEAFREAFREALAKGMAEHDPKACFVALPKFLRYNTPESPNVIKAWVGALDMLPECHLKSVVIQRAKAFAEGLSEGFAKALPEAFAKGMPYPEQEQEQEQEQEKERKDCAPSDSPTSVATNPPHEPSAEPPPAQPVPAAPPAKAAAVLLPTNSGQEFPLTDATLDEFAELYPAVDVRAEIRKIRGWLIANPARRKTPRGMLRFVNHWLSREQDRAGPGPPRGNVVRHPTAASQADAPRRYRELT